MTFEFNTDDRVIDMAKSGDRRTQGVIYPVINSYHGHSGAGGQEWVRTPDNRGHVSGVDPDRYMRFDPKLAGMSKGDQRVRLFAMREEMTKVLGQLRGPMFKEMEDQLLGWLNQVEALIQVVAEPLDHELLVIDDAKVEDHMVDRYNLLVGGTKFGDLWRRKTAKEYEAPSNFSLALVDGSPEIDLGQDYQEALERLSVEIERLRGGMPIGFWALTVYAAAEVAAEKTPA